MCTIKIFLKFAVFIEKVHIKVLYFLDREIVEHYLTLEYGELVLQLLVYLHVVFHTVFGHYVLFVLSSQLQERGIEADRLLEELFIEPH